MHLAPGQSIGRYVIESLLGEGGMGEVYRARDTRLERNVALKVLRKDTAEGASEGWEQAAMRMQREAQAVAALSHPGIVAIYDIGEHDGAPFIAMELIAGKPLREFVGAALPQGLRLRILLDVARALAAAHEAGFMHRDIKPENILVRPDHTIKVLDFGIARRTSHVDTTATTIDVQGGTIDSALVQMTADGVLLGTPAYMAPEQIRGETLDARADQFAWGVVAYELLTGKHPFHSDKGAMALMASILSDTPAPLEGIREDVAHIVLRALEKEPLARWESMQEIVSSWEQFVTMDETRPTSKDASNRNSLAERQPHPPEPKRKYKRHFVVGALAAMVGLVGVLWFSRRTPVDSTSTLAIPSASVMPSAMATAITDLPLPVSTSGEARAAFREGMQSLRDARWDAAAEAFLRARKADPEMAVAHLRYAMIRFSTDVPQARVAFRTAFGLRGTLSERDAALLHAFEPIIQRDPSDYITAAQRFETLVDRYPLDAELLFWYGTALRRSSISAPVDQRAIRILDRCVTIDPQDAGCWHAKANALDFLDRTDEAIAALDSCIARCDNAIACLQSKVVIESRRGRCGVVVEASRQLAVKDSMAPRSQQLYTEALYFSGNSEPTVRAAGEEAMRRFRNQSLEFDANYVATFLDVGFGDFDAAHRKFAAFAQPSDAPSLQRSAGLFLARIGLFIEMNQWTMAASLAQDALPRYSSSLTAESGTFDPLVTLHAILLRAGKISRQQYEATRSAWVAKHPFTTPLARQFLWLTAYGVPVFSKDLAMDALAEAERIGKPADLQKGPLGLLWAIFHGRALMLVGKPREALPYLERATRVCAEDTDVIWHIQSLALLGMAHEATGNDSLACEAYGKVLDRWGKSKQSVTAKDVAEHANKLHCGTTAK